LYVGSLGRGRLRRDCITDVVGCVTRVLLAGAVCCGTKRLARSPVEELVEFVYGMYGSVMIFPLPRRGDCEPKNSSPKDL